MQLNRVLQQDIAMFGETGSGKTVLVSSFYGSTQDPEFLEKETLFHITADDTGQGNRLLKNFLGMRDSARAPEHTRLYDTTSYAFTLRLRDKSANATKSKFDAVRLVWHDYPGEWWEKDLEPAIAERRVATFKSLLGSDVAFLLVDGQKLLDNAGEEERYLKSLFASFRTGLLKLKDQLLEDGKPLVKFPRIWILALSKADLLPEVEVFGFRDLVIGKAADDLHQLREVLMDFVESPNALAVGEDFLRLSSAKFEPNRIEVTERIGLDLVLPLAAMLPFQRHIKWIERQVAVGKVAEALLGGVSALAAALISKAKFTSPLGFLVSWAGKKSLVVTLTGLATLSVEQLRKREADARARKDYMAAVLSRFELDLNEGEEERVLLTSKK
jgi:Double-GTPase 2